MRSGRLIQGPEVEAFEQAVAEYVGVEHAVATSSGTTALHLALLAMGVSKGDKVLLPAFTFVATANAVLMCRAEPVLCDIDLEAFCVGYNNTPPQTVAMSIPVWAFGYRPDIPHIANALEDAACALGSLKLRGRAAIFSFHATKIITTGEGGMVLTNDRLLVDEVRLLRDQKHGSCLAYNYRMTEMQGAIGREQMKLLPWILKRRKEIATRYDDAFNGRIQARIPPKGGNYQSYVLLLNACPRDVVIENLTKRGVESLPGTQFLGDMPHLRIGGLPNARRAGRDTLRLPCYPTLTEAEQEHVIKAVLEVLGA